MNVQKTSPYSVSFGVKVPTKYVIDLVSGIRSKETNDVFLNLTGLSNEKMIKTMSSDAIELSKNFCSKEITNFEPALKKILQIKEDLIQVAQSASHDKSGNILTRINDLFHARAAEKSNLLNSMTDEIDLPKINLSL